jgi:ribosomal protein S6--L-glutamate ligase
VGLEVAAVDLLDVESGPQVFEVNSSPGIKEIEEATGVDVAAAIIARAAERVREGRRARSKPAAAPAARTGKAAVKRP